MGMDVPAELYDKQKLFQTARGLIHRKSKGDRLTSVIVPAGFTLVAALALVSTTFRRRNETLPK